MKRVWSHCCSPVQLVSEDFLLRWLSSFARDQGWRVLVRRRWHQVPEPNRGDEEGPDHDRRRWRRRGVVSSRTEKRNGLKVATSFSQVGKFEVMMMMGSCSWRFTLAVSFELTNSSWLMMGLKGIGISFHLSIDYGPVVLQLKMDNISLFWPKSRQFSRGKIYHFVKRAYFAFIGQLFLSISGDFLLKLVTLYSCRSRNQKSADKKHLVAILECCFVVY